MSRFMMVYGSQEFVVKLFTPSADSRDAVAQVDDLREDLTTVLTGSAAVKFCREVERLAASSTYDEAKVAVADAYIEDTLKASGAVWNANRYRN